MKDLDTLIPIWHNQIPPKTNRENDYLFHISATSAADTELEKCLLISWCPLDQAYVAQPVRILQTDQMQLYELHFDSEGIQQFRDQMSEIGITHFRNIINLEELKDPRQQLANIHPSLVPSKVD